MEESSSDFDCCQTCGEPFNQSQRKHFILQCEHIVCKACLLDEDVVDDTVKCPNCLAPHKLSKIELKLLRKRPNRSWELPIYC